METILKRYFQSWIDADIRPLKDLFSENVVYSECYGPEYQGLDQVLKWFEDWNKHGKVHEWTVKRVIQKERTLVAEWFFRYEHDRDSGCFNGVSIVDFDEQNRICSIREYESQSDHYFPYGE